jgi:E3 ubiquitin-protein ligase TRIP12
MNTTRTRRRSPLATQSATSIGKRRARSPPSPSQASSAKRHRKASTTSDSPVSSYNLRSRSLDEIKPTKPSKGQLIEQSPSNSTTAAKKTKMPRRNVRAGKAKATSTSVTSPQAFASTSATSSFAGDSSQQPADDDVRMEVDDPIPVSGIDIDAEDDDDVVMEADSMNEEDDNDDDDDDEEEEEEVSMGESVHEDEVHHDDEDEEEHQDDEEYVRSGDGERDRSEPYESSMGHFAASIRGLTGIMAGLSGRLKAILNKLRDKHNPTERLLALQELSEVLSMATEDTLAGYFSPEQYSKELVAILKGSPEDAEFIEGGEEGGVEMMLLACRCLANMMEALPGSTNSVVYAGAVPVLCAKLLEIQFIDLAEQTLSVSLFQPRFRCLSPPRFAKQDLLSQTLEKISEEMPGHIVREGGLMALLQFLDFFSTNVQRTAVTTAANCCRNLAPDNFEMVRDVIPILKNILSYPDQRVVEQACLAVTRVAESYRHLPDKLESLLTADVLSPIVGLLVPGAGGTISPTTYAQLLKALSHAARASPEVAIALLEMNIASTLYQVLTGVSAPSDAEIDSLTKLREEDDMFVLQNLVHRPKDQVQETLVLVTELLPSLPKGKAFSTTASHLV